MSRHEFSNCASGHKALLGWLSQLHAKVRVCLEATGIYSLDLALCLDRATSIEVAVLNPKLVNRFAQTLRRSKSDAADAVVLAEYSQRMPFTPWQRPGIRVLGLRAMGRHIESLVVERASVKNRLRTAEGTRTTPPTILRDLKQAQATLSRRIAKMRREAEKLIQAEAGLQERFALLVSVPGIGRISAHCRS